MKKAIGLLCIFLVFVSIFMLGCSSNEQEVHVSNVINEAQNLTFNDLCKKAIKESKGKKFFGLGNSSRGKIALQNFISYLKTIDSTYNMNWEWSQPKNNRIYEQLRVDSMKSVGTFAMTLIQDANQINNKMLETGVLKTFIPSDWMRDNGYVDKNNQIDTSKYPKMLSLQTLSKLFIFNNVNNNQYNNVWDFVYKNMHGQFMDIETEYLGENFLLMLTQDKYANDLKNAYEQLSQNKKDYFYNIINSNEIKNVIRRCNLKDITKYSLTWIKLWVENYITVVDDAPICSNLVSSSAKDQFGLFVYSKLQKIVNTVDVSTDNVSVACYNNNYCGFGGYAYNHYLFLTKNSPLPYTACAFIAFMTTKYEGFDPWGKEIGGYSSNVNLRNQFEKYKEEHSKLGKNSDKSFDNYWMQLANVNGINYNRLIIEDGNYCSSVYFTVGDWIESLKRYNH